MNKKTLQVAKIVEGYLGRNELIDWWRTTINLKPRKENGRAFSNRQLVQTFRTLKKLFKVEKTTKYLGRKPFIYYSFSKR